MNKRDHTQKSRWEKCMHYVRALTLPLLIYGCANQTPSYDPNAVESIGRIISKMQVGAKIQARADSPNMGPALAASLGPVGLGIGDALQKKTTLPIFEYRIKTEDGREIVVFSDYSSDIVGQCVRVFESSRPSYPRFISSNECQPRSIP